MTSCAMARLAVIVLVARLLCDLGTPLWPGAFGLERMGIEGAGARHQRSGVAVIAVRSERPRAPLHDVARLAEAPRIVAAGSAPLRPSSYRPLRLPPGRIARQTADDPAH